MHSSKTAPKQPQKFQKLLILETGMLSSYKLIVNTLKVKPLEELQKNLIVKHLVVNFKKSIKISDSNSSILRAFKMIFMKLWDKRVTLKPKYLTWNYSQYVTKELSNGIMLRTKFQSHFLKKTSEAKVSYIKQRNLYLI